MSHIRLLTKDEMIASGTLYNYELIMEDYLNAMPFNEKERKEVKMSLLIKINSAFDRVISGRDKKALKKLNKRFMELKKIAENGESGAIKAAFAEIDGLNLFLSNKKARLSPRPEAHSPQENIWVLLCKTLEKRAHSRSISGKSPFLEKFYNSARTYFMTKS